MTDFTLLGGRRFVMAMGAGVITTLLQWFGKLDLAGETYKWVILGTVGAYITGAVVDNKTAAKDGST